MIWRDGSRFEGQWKANHASGRGRLTQTDGNVYVGEWSRSMAYGFGTLYHNLGNRVYRGRWKNDLQYGHGVESWRDGSHFEGYLLEGKKDGFGCYTWSDGTR